MQLDPDTDLTFTRTLPVPPALVWACWTSADHIPHFFVPKPHKVVACDIDLRVGGRFNTTFEVDGNRMENHGVYLEIVPERRETTASRSRRSTRPISTRSTARARRS